MEHLSPWRKEKGPRERIRKCSHSNIMVPVAHGDTGVKEVWRERAKDGGVILVTGFPRVDGMANGDVHETNGHGANTEFISYNTCIRSTGVVPAVIPSKRSLSE